MTQTIFASQNAAASAAPIATNTAAAAATTNNHPYTQPPPQAAAIYSSAYPICTSKAPRVPLSSIVTVLVDEWSRSYTVGALQGDIESMCMLSSAHFARSGFGCIPHDIARGYDWLERAKKAVVDRAAKDAKRCGLKVCKRTLGDKEKELEYDILQENAFEKDPNDSFTDQSLDDRIYMSSGSVADSLASLSCGNDTNSAFINDVSVPSDASQCLPPSIESDGNVGLFADPIHSFDDSRGMMATPTILGTMTPIPSSRRSSLRSSISHPNLTASPEWRKWTEERHPPVHLATRGPTPAAPLTVSALYEESESEEEEDECTNNSTDVRSVSHVCVDDDSLTNTSVDTWHSVDDGASVGSSIPNSSCASEVDSPTHGESRIESPVSLTRSITN